MDTRDDDIEFDFFDEPATKESSQPRVRLPGRGGGSRRSIGPPRGTTPLLRLIALVVFVIFLVLVFGLLIQSCASSSKKDRYANYMADVEKIATQSAANGKLVANTLTTPGLSIGQVQNRLRGIAEQERQNVRAAEDLNPPGRLRDESSHVIDALGLRVSGIEGLANAFQKAALAETAEDAALLAAQADRLLASDIVWDDLFREPAVAQLEQDGVSGVNVPDSNFVQNRELVTAASMALVLERLRGASTGGTPTGLHGTNIVAVKAQPNDQTLVQGELNTVTATTELAFEVVVEDSGDSQEVDIQVTLTIEQGTGNPIVKTQTIDVINPGEQQTVTFEGLGEVRFATQTTLKVDVAPVPGEANKDNNSAQYSVIFSLP
ncbi:MAG TPA: hypothetical protein VH721_08160 [Gaiellaceae bacterium]|jgi:hypothetical protein